jgi:hypothetical protein
MLGVVERRSFVTNFVGERSRNREFVIPGKLTTNEVTTGIKSK